MMEAGVFMLLKSEMASGAYCPKRMAVDDVADAGDGLGPFIAPVISARGENPDAIPTL
jgi:hypothetical protein